MYGTHSIYLVSTEGRLTLGGGGVKLLTCPQIYCFIIAMDKTHFRQKSLKLTFAIKPSHINRVYVHKINTCTLATLIKQTRIIYYTNLV